MKPDTRTDNRADAIQLAVATIVERADAVQLDIDKLQATMNALPLKDVTRPLHAREIRSRLAELEQLTVLRSRLDAARSRVADCAVGADEAARNLAAMDIHLSRFPAGDIRMETARMHRKKLVTEIDHIADVKAAAEKTLADAVAAVMSIAA